MNNQIKDQNLDLKELNDIHQITQLLYRGMKYADDKQWDERASTFTDELTIDFGGVKPSQKINPKDLMEWAKLAYDNTKTQHMLFNLVITLNGDQATSTSYGHARHERMDTHDFWHIYASYENDYIRTKDGWKISRIKMTPNWQEGNPKLLDETFEASKAKKK